MLRVSILLSLLMVLALQTACYRESAVEITPVVGSRVEEDNAPSTPAGIESMGRIGDFVLQSSQVVAVVAGPGEATQRQHYLPKVAGSILDLSSRFESVLNRELQVRDDDGILQFTQGVNMNRHSLVSYESVQFAANDRNSGELILTGSVYDTDGSLAAAGVAVEANGRVRDLKVTTVYALTDIVDANEDDLSDELVRFLQITTMVQNTGDQTLPIFTVNDITVTQRDAYREFVPYPNWGFEHPDGNYAYAPYVQWLPEQRNCVHYVMVNQADGLVMTSREEDAARPLTFNYTGKIGTTDRNLPAGETYTYVREMFVRNEGTSQTTGTLRPEQAYAIAIEALSENPAPGSIYADTGRMITRTTRNGGVGGEIVFEMTSGVQVYDGTSYQPLAQGQVFPIFGDAPIATSYSTGFFGNRESGGLGMTFPTGDIRIRARMLNGEEVIVNTYEVPTFDDEGNVIRDEDNVIVTETRSMQVETDELTDVGLVAVSPDVPFEDVAVLMDDQTPRTPPEDQPELTTRARNIYGRVMVETDDADYLTGTRPRILQGRVANITTFSASEIVFPEGQYQLVASHGPLFNVNIVPVTVGFETIEVDSDNDGEPDSTVEVFGSDPISVVYSMSQALEVPNMFCADFGVRSSGDPTGLVAVSDLLTMTYAEDLDLVFFGDLDNSARTNSLFRSLGVVLGPFDNQDAADDVNSLFDEFGVSRATATLGRTVATPEGFGRFTVINLPDETEQEYVELPLFEDDPATYFDDVRERFPDAVIMAARPRGPQGLDQGFFTAVARMANLPGGSAIPGDQSHYYRQSATGAETRWIDFDILQLLNGNDYDEYLLARQDWFNLLNAGVYKPVVGGSAAGSIAELPIGVVRTYANISNTEIRDNDFSEYFASIREGNAFTTNGPIINASVSGASFGQTAGAGESVTLNLSIKAAPWIPVRQVRVVVNGVTQVLDINLNGGEVERFNGTVTVNVPGGNGWIVVEAGATLAEIEAGSGVSGTFGRVYPGHLPIAFGNPIFIGNN